jgi:hypothetical protein
VYDDGDEEWVLLAAERHKLIPAKGEWAAAPCGGGAARQAE